jgi:hypothetical protein
MKVHEALAAVMADVQAVGKSDRNTHQNFSFRGIDAVLNAVGPVLRKHGVVVLPDVRSHTFATVEVGAKRSLMGHVILEVGYTFVGPEGDSLTCCVLGEAMDSGDKAVPKAMSVAFRTALLQALALPTDEPDPDASTYERAAAPKVDVTALMVQVEQLLARAEDLVDAQQVRAYASQGETEALATIKRLTELLASA